MEKDTMSTSGLYKKIENMVLSSGKRTRFAAKSSKPKYLVDLIQEPGENNMKFQARKRAAAKVILANSTPKV